jgi:tetratricopeptide (TPR) repeat protein
VVVEEDAYQPVNMVVVVDPVVSQNTQVRIFLTPRDMTKANAPPGTVLGGNPNLIRSAEYTKKFAREVIKEFEAGVKADEANQVEKAMEHYRKAIQLAPDFYPAHNNLGVRLLSKSAFGDAEIEFREVLRLNKDDAQAFFNLGNVLYLTKRYAEAKGSLQEGLSKSPNSAFGNYLLGSVQMRQGNPDVAERLLLAAKQLDPHMPQVLLELASLYLQTGRKVEAKGQLEEFLRRFPKDPLVPKVKESLKKLAAPGP